MLVRRLIAPVLVILLLAPAFALSPAPPVAAAGECEANARYFPETQRCVPALFAAYWQSHGGLAQQGLPVTNALAETSETDGKVYTVQYFERARFEAHPENAPPYDVLLGLLGREQYLATGVPSTGPANPGGTCMAGERYFAETQHCVPALFATYWQGHGGLAQQGLPISDAFMEANPTNGQEYLTQYFERARFEAHPENQDPYDVLLGLLGREQVQAKYPGSPEDDPAAPLQGPPPVGGTPTHPPEGVLLDSDAKPVINWSVPNRYQRSWEAARSDPATYWAYANPARWEVTLNFCDSASKYAVTGYEFTVSELKGDYKLTDTVRNCRTVITVPSQGVYQVTLTMHTYGSGPGISLPTTHQIEIRDRLIVVMGDSLAAGEGNPDRPGRYTGNISFDGLEITTKLPATWQNQRCHRSALSGPARAARALEDASQYTSVTFIDVACSGASFNHLLGGEKDKYEGIAPDGTKERIQIDWVKKLVAARDNAPVRTIDILMLSVGLNEFHFGDIIESCVTNDNYRPGHKDCVTGHGGAAALRSLDDNYNALAAALSSNLPGIRETYLNDYPAAVFEGGACGFLADPYGGDLLGTKGLDPDEGEAMAALGHQLNKHIQNAAADHHWNFVSDLTPPFAPHSYCSKTPWFVHIEDSYKWQGDKNGTAHPNACGHMQYATLLLAAIKQTGIPTQNGNTTVHDHRGIPEISVSSQCRVV